MLAKPVHDFLELSDTSCDQMLLLYHVIFLSLLGFIGIDVTAALATL